MHIRRSLYFWCCLWCACCLGAGLMAQTNVAIDAVVQPCPAQTNGSIESRLATATDFFLIDVITGDTLVMNATGVFTGLGPGTYRVRASDGSLTDSSVVVPLISTPTTVVLDTSLNPSCAGSPTGVIVVSEGNGASPFSYALNTGQTSNVGVFVGLNAGAYTITATDDRGCTGTVAANLTDPAPLALAAVPAITGVTCFGDIDGSVTGAFTGGTGAIAVTLTGNGTTLTAGATFAFTALAQGSYLLSATDANGCQAATSVLVGGPTQALTLFLTNTVNSACGAQGTGSLTLLAVGGNGGYQYSLNGGPFGNNATFSNLATGSYVPVVRDANGCLDTLDNPAIIDAGNLTLTLVSSQNPTCNGLSNGALLFAVSGGQGPYDFALTGASTANVLNSSATAASFSTLPAGNYSLQVTDDQGCATTLDTSLTQPAPLTLNLISSANACQAELSATATGGTPPYAYVVNGINLGNVLANYFPGSSINTVLVSDANGCTVSQTDTLASLAGAVNIDDASATTGSATCFDSDDGSLNVAFTGNNGPFAFTLFEDNVFDDSFIANAPGTQSINTLTGGATYTLSVEDAGGCVDTLRRFVPRPDAIQATLVPTDAACFGDNSGTIEVQGTQGGTNPYQYRLGTTGALQSAATFTGLAAGAYQVQIRDNLGCESDLFGTTVGQPAQALDVQVLEVSDTLDCQGDTTGRLLLEIAGGTPQLQIGQPYRYELEAQVSGVFQLFKAGPLNAVDSITGLTTGTFRLTIFDARDCDVIRTFTIVERDPITWQAVTVTDVRCFGESNGGVQFSGVSGGTSPYDLTWINEDGTISGSDVFAGGSGQVTALTGERFIFTISDAAGCQTDTVIDIPTPAPLGLALGADTLLFIPCAGGDSGRVTLLVSGGNPGNLLFIQDIGGSLDSVSGLSPGQFSGLSAQNDSVQYRVEDALGCTDSLRVRISDAPPLVPTYAPTDSLFCSNDDSVVLSGTGIFSAARFEALGGASAFLVQDSVFLPSQLSGGDSLRINLRVVGVDQTINGCAFDSTIEVVVFDTLAIVQPVDTQFCSNADNFLIQLDPAGGTLLGTGISLTQTGEYLFIPNLFPEGLTTVITYERTDSSTRGQCRSRRQATFTVLPAPKASFEVSTNPLCEGQSVQFASDSSGSQFLHQWTFDSDRANPLTSQIVRTALPLGSNQVVYQLTDTTTGCVDSTERQINVQAVPRFDFAWDRICEGDTVQLTGSLTDTSNLSQVNTLSWVWTFADGSVQFDTLLRSEGFGQSLIAQPFDTLLDDLPTSFLTQVAVSTDNGCVDTVSRGVTILPVLRPTGALPYQQDFDNDSLPWLSLDGSGVWGWVPFDPTDTTGLNPPFGTGTLTVQPNANYGPNLIGNLLSPCFDLSGLQRPLIALDIWSQTDAGNDGTVLQYLNESRGSSDWQTLGRVDDGVATGLNWFNRSDIFARPGEPNLQGWSGDFQGYREAVHRLDLNDLAATSARSRVRFRVAFASDDRDQQLAGFSLDAVRIDERKRQVLWESFDHSDLPEAAADSVNLALDSLVGDFQRLSYAIAGDFADINPTPPRVRSLYYGISLPYQGVLDGNQYNAPLRDFSLNDLNLRSLLPPQVDSLFLENGSLQLGGVNQSGLVALRLALVEDLPNQAGLVRAILPDGAGRILVLTEAEADSLALDQAFAPTEPLTVEVEDPSQVYGVVWLQHVLDKEVWQVARLDGLDWGNLLANLSLARQGRPSPPTQASDIRVYPVPAQQQLTIALPQVPSRSWPVSLFDQQGRLVRQATGTAGAPHLQLDLSLLSDGLYHLRFQDPHSGAWQQVKVSVLR